MAICAVAPGFGYSGFLSQRMAEGMECTIRYLGIVVDYAYKPSSAIFLLRKVVFEKADKELNLK